MPDGLVSSRDFVQTFDQGPVAMGLSVTAGNTIIFDSFTPEQEVRRRNVAKNNVSKLNQMQNRFQSEFCVGVCASSVTSILCASTVGDYRVVDKKTGDTITASDKRPGYMRTWNEEQARKQTAPDYSIQNRIPAQTAAAVIQADQSKRQRIAPTPQSAIIPALVVPNESRDIIPGIFAPRTLSQMNPSATPQSAHVGPNDSSTIIPGIFAPPTMSRFSATPQSAIISAPNESIFRSPPPPSFKDLVHHVTHNLLPDIMTFTSSSSPPLSPRRIDDNAAAPFPFKDHATPSDHPPIFADLPPQPGTSDNIRAVVLIGDVMQHPPDIDDVHQGANYLNFLSSTSTTRPIPLARG